MFDMRERRIGKRDIFRVARKAVKKVVDGDTVVSVRIGNETFNLAGLNADPEVCERMIEAARAAPANVDYSIVVLGSDRRPRMEFTKREVKKLTLLC